MNESSNPGWERRDARMRPILVFTASLTALVVLAFALGGVLSRALARRPEPPRHSRADRREPPRGPLLQTNAPADLERHRERDARLLGEYAWIDPTQDVIRVPIERAMELVLERGLPVAEETPR